MTSYRERITSCRRGNLLLLVAFPLKNLILKLWNLSWLKVYMVQVKYWILMPLRGGYNLQAAFSTGYVAAIHAVHGDEE